MKKTFLSFIIIFISLFSFSQNNSPKPKNTVTGEDWDNLNQHEKDSISKIISKRYAEEMLARQKSESAEAESIIEEALKDANSTKSLQFQSFPKTQFDDDILKFKNLEEFTCERCKALDLNILFAQLAQLPKLKRLNLSGGAYKVLPNDIQKLSALEDLQLGDNNFTTLPDSFINLKKLKTLNLKHNSYLYDDEVYSRLQYMNVEELNFSASGLLELSSKIGLAKSLKSLDISVNDIKLLPDSFHQLTNLKHLDMSRNMKMDFAEVVSVLAQIPGLEELILQESNLDNLPLDMGKLNKLKILDLKGNLLTSLPLTFGNLANLEYLDLGYLEMGRLMNKIDDLGPNFGQLKKLKYLNLSGNALQILPSGFSGLNDLEDLNLSMNKLPGFPLSVTQLTRLKKLDLSLNDVSSVPNQVGNLVALEELHLDANFFNHPDKKIKTLPDDICKLKNLKVLTLKDNVIEHLPDCIGSLSRLEKLDLRDNLIAELPASFAGLKNLKSLDLKANDFSELPPDFQSLSSLKELNLSMNTKLSYTSAKEKFVKMPHLEFLDLSYNNISKDEITSLRDALPDCKVINWDYEK